MRAHPWGQHATERPLTWSCLSCWRPCGLGLLLAAGLAQASETLPPPRPQAAPTQTTAVQTSPVQTTAGPAAEPPDPAAAAALFATLGVAEETRAALAGLPEGNLAAAAAALDGLVARHPEVGAVYANRAALAMLQGETETAMTLLGTAAAHGFTGLPRLAADPIFAPLAGDPRLARLLAAAPVPVPAPVTDGTARVNAGNTTWNPDTERLEPRFAFPGRTDARVVPKGDGPAAPTILADLWSHGRAAGNWGDLYDNRDRGHSRLDLAAHPQLTDVTYADAARAADLDYGLNEALTFDHPTFGNSSTAITGGALWRSLPRYAMTQADGTGPLRLWQNAAQNQLYVYPSHKDYTAKAGDLFPANTPYILVSRGSSGSDKPFLDALALIYAAFRPDTKERLTAENLIVPTVQMIFRRSLQNVRSRADYLSGAAHPAAFEGYEINPARMVSLANSIKVGDIPPRVVLRVTAEDLGTEGRDFFGQGLSEQLFDTPSAIARIWRAARYSRTMQVSAAATTDPAGRPLTFEWRLLQGDPERVRVEPAEDGRSARITLDWQEPFRISEDNPLTSSRVDIGVFANNGAHDSAPAIISWYFPPEEARSYTAGPEGAMHVTSIDYAARPAAYADPMLIPRVDWRDDYHYAPDGSLTGWTRTRGARTDDYTADGARILVPATATTPDETEGVAYPLSRRPDGSLGIEEISAPLP